MCLFSAVGGRVLDHGVPVEEAGLERTYAWSWTNRSGDDRAVTDVRGDFAFPAIRGRALLGSILPHEPVVDQTILIHHGGKTSKAWMLTRGNYLEKRRAWPAHHAGVPPGSEGDAPREGPRHLRAAIKRCGETDLEGADPDHASRRLGQRRHTRAAQRRRAGGEM